MKVWVYLHKDGFLTQYDHELNNDEKMMMFGNGKITLIGLQDLPIEPVKKEVIKTVPAKIINRTLDGRMQIAADKLIEAGAYEPQIIYKVKE